MIARLRHWLAARRKRKHAEWLRRNKVILPRVPSWDRFKAYQERKQ